MTNYGTLELCECNCAQQVHMLGRDECGNPECPTKCQSFKGTGQLHKSAFCENCGMEKGWCDCMKGGYDSNYD